ncbi:hypothetical protein SAMN05892883_2863 [Jatrophihabitans sp. GAS493]|nr:hypothetical protein SAMN05892883_2863 [Jatrophihabitans sp. GAS493]
MKTVTVVSNPTGYDYHGETLVVRRDGQLSVLNYGDIYADPGATMRVLAAMADWLATRCLL